MTSRNTWIAIGLVALAMLIEAGAEFSLATWAQKNPAAWLLVMGIFLYAVIGGVYGYSLKYSSITIANTMWQLLSIVVISLIGVFAFKDAPTVGQWVGIGFATLAGALIVSGAPELGEGKGWFKEWSPLKKTR